MRAPGMLVAAVLAFSCSAVAQPDKPFRDCPTCPEMVVIPAGTFTMGSTPAETTAAGLPDEQAAREWPAHSVTIAKPFAVGRYELTVGEYAAFAEDTKRPAAANCTTWSEADKKWGPVAEATWRNPGYAQTDRFPVGCLTIDDARAYAGWLSAKTGHKYRVPSEAEWEYIARAEPRTKDICAAANVSDRMRLEAHGGDAADTSRFFNCRDGYVYAAPVGSFPPNTYGLSDVIGNIWEWTEDCFIPGYDGAPSDGSVRMVPGCERLIVRGGGWYSRTWFARAAGRSREASDYRSSTLGLRVVRDMP
jgi:formylglycine-generating enzyme required for sulfatase activity